MQTHPIIVEIDKIYVQNIPLFRNVATWQLEKCADTGGTDADTIIGTKHFSTRDRGASF